MIHRKSKIKDFDPCGQKTFYVSKKDAWENSAIQNRESLGNIVKKPYKCKYCNGWHLTSIL